MDGYKVDYYPLKQAFIFYNDDYSLSQIKKATPQSSCYDLYADNIEEDGKKIFTHLSDDGIWYKGEWQFVIGTNMNCLITCGFKLVLPEGYEAQIRSRSGMALDKRLFVLNSPGTIDSDYRGEVKVILMNLAGHPVKITKGMKIAQMKILSYTEPELQTITKDVFDKYTTERGAGGFGSTGN